MQVRIALTTTIVSALIGLASASALASGARGPDKIGQFTCTAVGQTFSHRLPPQAFYWGDYRWTLAEARESAVESCRADYRYFGCRPEICYRVDLTGQLRVVERN